MLTFFRWPIRIFAVILIVFVLYINVKLYDLPHCVGAGSVNADALKQLHYLRRMLHEENAGQQMQLLYPEGYVFTYALYALAWCDRVERLPPGSRDRQEGMNEITWSLDALDSPVGKSVFNPDLPLPYGAFYCGWTAFVRGHYLGLLIPAERDSMAMRQFQGECAAIAGAIGQTEKPFLESYHDMAWPADNIVCLAALSLHDDIAEPRFQEVKSNWLQRIRSALVPEYGLIPHGFDLQGNQPSEGVRGSSQSLILCFLKNIDASFSQEQYQIYRRHFLTYRLGLPGIREYPHGIDGSGDIDSGPVVTGIGGAASIVGIRAALQHGDLEVAAALYAGVNGLLLPWEGQAEKHYLFGQLPLLDAFTAWSSAGMCETNLATTGPWRGKCQFISVFLIAACFFLIRKTAG